MNSKNLFEKCSGAGFQPACCCDHAQKCVAGSQAGSQRHYFQTRSNNAVPPSCKHMNYLKWSLVAALLGLLPMQGAENSTSADGKGAVATGNYRNLFAEGGHSSKE